MQNIKKRRLTASLWALTFVYGAAVAQQPVPEQVVLPPLPPPIYQPGELPPLPPPTEQQLQRGRKLLDKIAYVIANVPLTDAAAVLKVFGFTELNTVEYPTHVDIEPRAKDGEFLSRSDLKRSGLQQAANIRLIKKPALGDWSALLSARFDLTDVCVSIDEVQRVFMPMSSSAGSSRIVATDPVARPKPLHGVGNFGFSSLRNQFNRDAGIVFGFEYQVCARDFSFSYQNTLKDVSK